MRKLAMALLLSATLPAIASVQSDIDSGLSAADAFSTANASCDTSACTEQVLADLFAANVSIEAVLAIAANTGVSVGKVQAILIAGGADPSKVLAATAAGKNENNSDSVVVKPTVKANVSAN